MKRWILLTMVVCLIIALASCSAPTPTTAPTVTTAAVDPKDVKGVIRMATNRTDIVDTEFPKWAQKFNETYPNVEVKFEAYSDYFKDIKVQLASNEVADISLIPDMPSSDLPKYYAALDDLGLNDKILFKDLKSFEGKLYGIADGIIAYLVTYNKPAFAKAGITDVPKTWDEFLVVCGKLKDEGILPLATNFKDGWPLIPWTFAYGILDGNNKDYINQWTETDAPWTVDGPAGKSVALFKKLVEMGYVDSDLVSTNWMQTFPDMATGKIGMVWLGNYMTANAVNVGGGKADDFGYFAMPLDNGSDHPIILQPDWCYAVAKNSKSTDAAKAFLKFLLLESGYAEYAGMMSPIKDAPASDKNFQEFLDTKPAMFEPNPTSDKATSILNKAQIDLYKMYQEMILETDLQKVLDAYNKKWADAKKSVG